GDVFCFATACAVSARERSLAVTAVARRPLQRDVLVGCRVREPRDFTERRRDVAGGLQEARPPLAQAAAFTVGARGGVRSTDVTPAVKANAASSTSASFTPASKASSDAARVRSPIPV